MHGFAVSTAWLVAVFSIGVTQKTAWRIGHAIRLMTTNSNQLLDGVVA
jgi:hypothetical protein